MGILIGILFFVLSGWALVALFRRLRCQHVSTCLWFAFAALIVCGITLGFWCGFYFEYPVDTHFRVWSFPIPIGFFHLEDGRWIGFPRPVFQMWLTAFADIITITALVASPLWLVLRRYHKNDRVA